MKLEYRVLKLAKGYEWQCDFCIIDYHDPNNLALNTALATHEMEALDKKTGGYADTTFICGDCKKDFENNILPWCEECGRLQRHRNGCFCHLEKEKLTKPISEDELIARSFSSRLENKTRELEKELSAKEEEITVHLDALQVSEKWSKEKIKRIKELEAEVARLNQEVERLKTQLQQSGSQQIAQIEVKEVKKQHSWLRLRK